MTRDDSDRQRTPGDLGPGEAEQEGVSRLLAATADDPPAPMPDDVVRRLDDVLAGLVAERSGTSTGDSAASQVANLTPRRDQRRARRWPSVLVAAATVSVLGLGIGNVMRDTGSGQSSEAGADTAAGAEDSRGSVSRENSPPDPVTGLDQRGPGPASVQEDSAAKDRDGQARILPELRSETLKADARRFAGISLGAALTTASPRTPGRCAVPATGQGDDMVSVRLDGKAATMVLRARKAGMRLVEVYACDSAGTPVASTTVDAN